MALPLRVAVMLTIEHQFHKRLAGVLQRRK